MTKSPTGVISYINEANMGTGLSPTRVSPYTKGNQAGTMDTGARDVYYSQGSTSAHFSSGNWLNLANSEVGSTNIFNGTGRLMNVRQEYQP